MISRKITALKFCLICIIILGNDKNVLIIGVKFLIIRFIVLLTSCLIPRMSNTSALTELINLTNMETFGSLCHTFHIKLMVLPRVFDVLYCFNLSLYRTTYSNWRLLNLARGLSWLRLIAIYFLLKTPLPDFLIVMIRFLMPFQLPLPSLD
jgi:hypothetical protein